MNVFFFSESSLSDRVLSSDGLDSTQTSFSSSSVITNESSFQDSLPYKPEFIKYLESNLNHIYLITDILALFFELILKICFIR
jgi:hypothetical protein